MGIALTSRLANYSGENVPNQDIQAAWHYHNGTKHPDGPLMNRWHSYDPMNNPLLFKIYAGLEPIHLPQSKLPSEMPALSAISTNVMPSTEGQIPDLTTLGKILYFSAGITKTIKYPWGEMSFRAAACTGALFHIELYVVCGDLPGLQAGVYHLDSREMSLKLLREGDYRAVLQDATGHEPSVVNAPAIIVCTDTIWRNSCKYQAREYRHAFWDCGTILANTLAVSSASGIPSQVVGGFVDGSVNRLLDLDTSREVTIALVSLGHSPPNGAKEVGPAPVVGPLSLEVEPISDYETDFPAISQMHDASSLDTGRDVTSWRGHVPPETQPDSAGPGIILNAYAADEGPRDSIDSVIMRRGSSRTFAPESISFKQLSTVLDRAARPIQADFLDASGGYLNDIYLIVNAVEGIAPGTYVFHRDPQALELLEEGDFRQQAGVLGLSQELPADASVNFYFLSALGPILERFGNRGYRAAQLDASITAGRIYLAAYAQRLGATGLTFYDDAVTSFFSPHARDKSVMFLVAVGKRARRQELT